MPSAAVFPRFVSGRTLKQVAKLVEFCLKTTGRIIYRNQNRSYEVTIVLHTIPDSHHAAFAKILRESEKS